MSKKCVAGLGLTLGTVVIVCGASILAWLSAPKDESQLVEVTNPLLKTILATNGWSVVRSNQLFKLVRRFDGAQSTLQLVDAHDIQNELIARGCWKRASRLLRSEIVVDDKGVWLRHLSDPKEKLRTGTSPCPVWDITEKQAKWLRGWFSDDLKVEGCLFSGPKQKPDLKAFVAFFSPTQKPMKIPMDVLIPQPYDFSNP